MRVLVTGAAGFIGSNFVRHLLCDLSDYEVIALDKLTYAGNLKNLDDLSKRNDFRFVRADITDKNAVMPLMN